MRTVGGSCDDVLKCLRITKDRGYIISSTSSSGNMGWSTYLINLDSSGNSSWGKLISLQQNSWVEQLHNESYAATGWASWGNTSMGCIALALTNKYGNAQWNKLYRFGNYDKGRCLKQAKNKSLTVFGVASNNNGDLCLLNVDTMGNVLWSKVYGSPDQEASLEGANSLITTFESGYLFAGSTYDPTDTYQKALVVKTDSMGDTLWTNIIGEASSTVSYIPHAVCQTSDSSYIIVGERHASSSWSSFMLKLSKNGAVLWNKHFGGSNEVANSVVELSNKNLVLGMDGALFITDSSGNFVWATAYYNVGGWSSIAEPTKDNGFIIGMGTSLGQPNNGCYFNIAIVKTDSAGMTNCSRTTLTYTPLAAPVISSLKTIQTASGLCLDTLNSFLQTSSLSNQDICSLIGIRSLVPDNELEIFPNPASNFFSIETGVYDEQVLEITDLIGQSVWKKRVIGKVTIDARWLNEGTYILSLRNALRTINKKLIVVR